MPFRNVTIEEPSGKSVEGIDTVVLDEVLPNIKWNTIDSSSIVVLLPNSSIIQSERGPMEKQELEKYFVLLCLRKGLPYGDVGRWLDFVLENNYRNIRGRSVIISSEASSLLGFDRRKPIYYFGGVPRRNLIITEK